MKKFIAMLVSAVICVGLSAGCGCTADDDTGGLTGVVNTEGSTSMEKVVKGLAEAFMEENKGVTVNYSGTGSGSGVQAAVNGTADIGLASRALTQEELENGAVAHVTALDGVAVIVNPANAAADLTVEQIAGIFTGEISNWSELGGRDAVIAVYGREASSGTRSAFEEIIGAEDRCRYINEYSSTGDMVGSVAGNPNGIGYASLSAANDTVKTVKVNGVECTEENIKNGSYQIQRPFAMVVRDGAELSAAARAFMEYALSEEAAGIISLAGAVAP